MSRFVRACALALAIVMIAVVALGGCAARDSGSTTSTTSSGSSIPSGTPKSTIRIGTLPTEDSLPLWVAEKQGMFEAQGLDVQIQMFQSAQERDAALAAGSIDGFMGDIIAAANLTAGGTPVQITTVMLGADPSQGRFGVAVSPKSAVTSLKQLANVPIGTSSATIQEYVLDGLMAQAGVPADQVKVEEVKKVPVRFELLMSDKLKAAALPEPFLSLAEKQGAKVIADDTKGANLSQTVLVFSQKYLENPGSADSITKLMNVWNQAVAEINANKAKYRSLLVEKARLPKPLESSYQVNTYPQAAPPSQQEVESVLAWMKQKGYLKTDLTYGQLIYTP